jgi:hypothetical protein
MFDLACPTRHPFRMKVLYRPVKLLSLSADLRDLADTTPYATDG